MIDVAQNAVVPALANRLTPDEMAARLNLATFTGKGDHQKVEAMYRAFYGASIEFDRAAKSAGFTGQSKVTSRTETLTAAQPTAAPKKSPLFSFGWLRKGSKAKVQ